MIPSVMLKDLTLNELSKTYNKPRRFIERLLESKSEELKEAREKMQKDYDAIYKKHKESFESFQSSSSQS